MAYRDRLQTLAKTANMADTILHISGPRGAGKSTLVRLIASLACADRVHHIRFDLHGDDAVPHLRLVDREPAKIRNHHCYVSPQTVFETFAEVVPSVTCPDESSVLMIETDAHPCFRNAYPYDGKVFIMPPPARLDDVFRQPEETAGAIDRAMHDTAEFAAELFGLERVGPQDSAWLPALDARDVRNLGDHQTVDEFLNSPIGIEIAARLHLRPMFQGIVDCDVVFVNTSLGGNMSVLRACTERLERLIEPLRERLKRRLCLAACDPLDRRDPATERGLRHVTELLAAARTTQT